MRIGFGSTALAAVLLATTVPAFAQTAEPVRRYEIAAGPLDRALTAFARQSGQQILYPSALVAGRRSPGANGSFSVEDALGQVLRDTGLTYRRSRPNVFVLVDPAQRAEADLDVTNLDEVVVTGSYLRGATSPSPVTIIDRDDLDRRGRATAAEALASLPQNFTGSAYEGSAGTGADLSSTNVGFSTGLNLRGLGADATLVLVNGRRVAGTGIAGDFADVSNIPTAAIERVDVLLDGASALYGSDAVGGVVNVILKDRFEGFESRIRLGGTSDGGAEEFLFSQTGGWDWSSGTLVVAYEHFDRGHLAADQRRATASADLRPLGGSDWREFYSAPGNIMQFGPNGLFPAYAIPRGQNGVGLTPADLQPGVVNLENQNQGRWFLPHQTRDSVFLAASQDLRQGLTIDGELRYTDRRFDTRSFADIAFLSITSANPHFVSPDGSTSSDIAYSFSKDLGPGVDEGSTESLGGSLGLEGDFLGWNFAGYLSAARETLNVYSGNRANQTFLSEALGATPDNPSTEFSTSTDGFFNPYGDPAANSAEMLAFIGSGFSDIRNVSTVTSVNVRGDGVLFNLPAGPVRLAVGVDARREVFQPRTINFFFGSTIPSPAPQRYERSIEAAFIEARIPFVSAQNARPGVQRLELSLAARTERYDDIGSTTNPKIGLLYAPASDLLLRASYGESFRAPSLPELNSRSILLPTVLNNGTSDVVSLIQYGGNPDLKPETATSTTAGFVWTPARVDGLRLEANWFRIEYSNRISAPASDNADLALIDPSLAPFVALVNPGNNAADRTLIESLLADPRNLLPNIFPVDSYGAVVDARNVNSATLLAEGVDVTASYRLTWGEHRIDFEGAVTHLSTYDRQITPTSDFDALVGQAHYPVAWKGRAGSIWSRGPWSLGLHANYTGSGRNPLSGDRIDSWVTFDGQARWNLSSGFGPDQDLSLTLNVQNLLNEDPPFYDASRGFGFDAANANVLGRQISLQLTKRW